MKQSAGSNRGQLRLQDRASNDQKRDRAYRSSSAGPHINLYAGSTVFVRADDRGWPTYRSKNIKRGNANLPDTESMMLI